MDCPTLAIPRTLLLVVVALAVQAVAAGTITAQVRGIVTSASGRPLGSVVVELWHGGASLSSRITDTTGLFGFPAGEARGASELSARRIGFTARRVRLEPGDSVLRIALDGMASAPTAVALERIRESCPNEAGRDAREIWTRLRQRYRSADSVVLATTFSLATTIVSGAELGTRGMPRDRQGSRAIPGTMRVAWRRRIAREGYAWLLSYAGEGMRSKTWEYPPLESDFAQHFVDELFGSLHRLAVVARSEDEIVLSFCPAAGAPPALSGVLLLRGDTTLARAVWTLRTPKPEEDSGGEAIFTAYDAGKGLPILLPRLGMTWRTHVEGGFVQRLQSYDRWTVDQAPPH